MAAKTAASPARAVRLRTNARVEPQGLDDPRPEFSWQIDTPAKATQTGYRVVVTDETTSSVVWDAGEVASGRQSGVRYAGDEIQSSRTYSWRVEAKLSDGSTAEAATATFTTGVLDTKQWKASWITSGEPMPDDDSAALYLRGALHIDQPVVRARAYSSALGWYRLLVNGDDLTGSALVPRWTPLDQVVEYQTHDLTERLSVGLNIIAMAVGDGRYRGSLGFRDARRVYGRHLAGFVQIELELEDGSTRVWTTDDTWVAGPGRITSSDPKKGERVDMRLGHDDWLTQPAAPRRFQTARVLPAHSRRLIAEEVEPVQAIAHVKPLRVWRAPSGNQLADFGQNAAGVVRIALSGPAGDVVALTHSEVLTVDGELDDDYVHGRGKTTWTQRDEVILDGNPTVYQPWFTIHGFRYLEIDGLAHDLGPDDIQMVVLSTDVEQTGSFTSSDERLNRLWQNVLWSTRSNFVDTPTDCPTRERSGWTGDIQVFAPTATGLIDVQAYLRRYLRNLALEQQEDGRIPPFIPSEASTSSTPRAIWALGRFLANSVGWGDASTFVPWTLYSAFGDERVLADQYDSMRIWVDYMARRARRRSGLTRRFSRTRVGHLESFVFDSGFHWGEWLRPGEHFPNNALEGTLHGAVVATAYLARSSQVLSNVAEVLGRDVDRAYYADLAVNVREAWNAAFVSDQGRRIGTDRQDDYVRALAFELLPPEHRIGAATRLVELVEAAGDHLQTGFLSTPMLLPVLAEHGHLDVAYRLLLQDTAPSWLGQVDRDATTIWETWDGYDEDGNAQASHNHYAFGAVAAWLRTHVLGIEATSPGYRTASVRPLPGGGLTWAEGDVETPFGRLAVRWEIVDGGGVVDVTVPSGMSVTVTLPDGSTDTAEAGSHGWTWASGVSSIEATA